jgi:hypothetical protein
MAMTSTVLSTRALSAEDLIRIRASTDERQSTTIEWQGQVLYVCTPLIFQSLIIADHSSQII